MEHFDRYPIFLRNVRGPCARTTVALAYCHSLPSFSGLILQRLFSQREIQIRENQAGFRPGRGCVDHIFTLHQILEQRHTLRQPIMVGFLDFKSAFDSVDRQALRQCLALTKFCPF